jgi:N-acetylglucosaminyl-diphospho-decaprenol L-rhamnosyltransferase
MSDSSTSDVTIVIPAWNRADLLARCLAGVEGSRGLSIDCVVVDNGSPEDLSAVRLSHPSIRWIESHKNIGYAAANNLGLEQAPGRYVCLLNADAELKPDTLATLARFLDEEPTVGAVTPANVDPSGALQPCSWLGHRLSMAWLQDSAIHILLGARGPFRAWARPGIDLTVREEVQHCQTTCLVVRAEAHRRLNGMDQELFLFYNDVDYCLRMRMAGWKIIYLPECAVVHHGSASVLTAPWKERQVWRDRYRYCRKWYGVAGTAGVRFAILSRLALKAGAQLIRGRFAKMKADCRDEMLLLRALNSPDAQ